MSYPDWLVVEDDRFSSLVLPNGQLERLWQAGHWCEGPAYFAAGRYLLWSDIPNDRILRYDENDGHVSVFRQPAAFSNGQTLDRDGRFITCEHGSRSVTRTEHNGHITTLADAFEGRRLNSPNDVVVNCDGSIWFTDPSYGIDSDYEGGKRRSELDCHVDCLTPGGELRRVAEDFEKPNGLAFSPTKPGSTYRILARHIAPTDPGISGDSASIRIIACRAARCSRYRTAVSSTVSAWISPATCGPAPATVFTATPRMALASVAS